jgi:hypothetical protein
MSSQALGKWRQEDLEFEAILGHPVSKKNKKTNNNKVESFSFARPVDAVNTSDLFPKSCDDLKYLFSVG